jgi:2-haloacid dehalogenase
VSPVVTCDVLSALTDSHRGATTFLTRLTSAWPVTPAEVARAWDSRTKELHRTSPVWRSHARLATQALVETYVALDVLREPRAAAAALLDSVAAWPLWPDVEALHPAPWAGLRVGLLTNCDDDLLGRTRAAVLPWVDPELLITSQALQAYKPATAFYDRARERIGPFVHVAASARDVRGALEAGLTCVRLARPGHTVDPEGPSPAVTVHDAAELPDAVRSVLAGR